MIPKDKIEEVRDRASIVAVISEYIPLTKRGANHLGLCPFHTEKTPSFTVSEEKKLYYCFGCNASGNAISFLMKKEGATFPDAVRTLARRYGVSIVEEKERAPGVRDLVFRALDVSAGFFTDALKSARGARAKKYLEARGFELDSATASEFRLGFAPDSWDSLIGVLKSKGVSMEVAARAGLVKERESGGYYDRFRGRIIFPITDVRGRVIGFGARGMDDDATPKYLNSPEGELFKKGDVLYGLYQARQAIREKGFTIVVEGYFDLLSLHVHGFTNTVATMGTALTAAQIRTLKGYAPSVYALFDSDPAGRKAALRVLPLFIDADVPCRAVLLPQGKDPDEFLKLKGADAMAAAVKGAVPLMEFYLDELGKRTGISTPEAKRAYLDGALEYLPRLKNAAEQGHYVAQTAAMLGIPVGAVYGAMGTKGPGATSTRARAATPRSSTGAKKSELTILKVVASHPELYDQRVAEAIEAFGDALLKEAGRVMVTHLAAGHAFDAAAAVEGIEDDQTRGLVAGLLLKDDGFIENPEKMLEDSLKRVLNRGTLKTSTREMIKKLEESGRREVAGEIEKRVASRRGAKGS